MPLCGEGAASRMIRKPENLPVIAVVFVVPSMLGASISDGLFRLVPIRA